jgi:hypothetical protein
MTKYLVLQTVTLTGDGPVLSSDRLPYNNKTVTVKQYIVLSIIPILLGAPDGARHQD